jgi:Uri superfamily endonuclease
MVLHGWCISCRRKNESKDQIERKFREGELKRRYGITKLQYEQMLKKQKNVCAICKQKCLEKAVLSVDHDKETGKVRGLLCSRCNLALGLFYHDSKRLTNAARYVDSC